MKERMKAWGGRLSHFLWAHWWWVRLSPFVIAAFAIFVSLTPKGVTPDQDLTVVTLMWIFVAGLSAIFADLMRRRTKRLVRIAQVDLSRGDPLRILTETNHFTLVKTEIVHILFLALGVSIYILPAEVRLVFSRADILVGQYLLFMIVLKTYLASRE